MVAKDTRGRYRIVVREIVYNSEGFPQVETKVEEPSFSTAMAAHAHARDSEGNE
jgi:hypothetical protein